MKNIKLHASPHPAESAAACPEVWDAEGDSRDLAGRCSSNLRGQNLRRSAELHRRPAAGRRRPAASPAAGQGRPAAPPALPRPPSYSSSPSPMAWLVEDFSPMSGIMVVEKWPEKLSKKAKRTSMMQEK
jgi:hypothetical protein